MLYFNFFYLNTTSNIISCLTNNWKIYGIQSKKIRYITILAHTPTLRLPTPSTPLVPLISQTQQIITQVFVPPVPTFAPRFVITTQSVPILSQLAQQPQRQIQRFDTTVLNTNHNNNFNTISNFNANNNIPLNRRLDQSVQKNVRLQSENQVNSEYNRRLQMKEQQNHILFWQNQQSKLKHNAKHKYYLFK